MRRPFVFSLPAPGCLTGRMRPSAPVRPSIPEGTNVSIDAIELTIANLLKTAGLRYRDDG